MKKLLSCLALAFAFSVLAEQQIKVSSYRFSAQPMQDQAHQDPEYTKLTDTVMAGGKGLRPHVVWRYKDFGEKPLQIDFNLETPAQIESIRIMQFRWKRSYGIKEIRAIGTDANGNRFSIGNIVLNQPYNLPENEPHDAPVIIKSNDNTAASSVQLIFTGTGGYLGLNEVEFFGTPQPVRQEVAQKLNMLADNAKPGLRVFQHGAFYVLENDYAIYAIDPRYCGALSMAWDKLTKSNLVKFAETGTTYGPLFQDRFYPGGAKNRDMYLYRQYKAEILKDLPDIKQVRTWGVGHSGIFSGVEISKVYTLEKSSSVITVDITISNQLDNVIPLKYAYWLAGGLHSDSEAYTRIVPGQLGTEIKSNEREVTSVDFVDGWCGGMVGDNVLAILFPYELSKEIYYWGANKFNGTIEVKFGVYPIDAGGSITLNCAVAPFGGIGVPANITQTAAASFTDDKIRLRLFKPGKYSLRILAGKNDAGETSFTPLETVQLPDNVTYADIPWSRKADLLRIELLAGEQVVFSASKSDGVLAIPQAKPRKPDASGAETALNLDFHSNSFKTEHWNWGEKFATGKPKVLFVNNVHGGIREAVELSERFSIDLTTNYVAGYWSLSGHCMSLSPTACLNELSKKLDKKFDVIIVSSDMWNQFQDNVKTKIREQVANGSGLILCGSEDLPEEWKKLFPEDDAKKFRFKATWEDSTHPLAAELPLAQMPVTRFLRYQVKENVIAKADGSPVLAEAAFGQGRVFLATWETKRPNPKSGKYNSASTFMLPLQFDEQPDISHKYHEYQYALLGRIVQAAAGLDSGVTAKISATPGGTKVMLKSGKNLDADVRLTLRNKYSEEIASFSKKVALPENDATEVSFEYAEPDLTGLHFADIVIAEGTNGALWWGAAVFQVDHPAIKSVQLEERVYRPDENVQGTVVADGKVRVTLFDTYGNALAKSEGDKFSFPLAGVRTPNARLLVELLSEKGKVRDKVYKRIEKHTAPDPRTFNISWGWPGYSSMAPVYLINDILRLDMEQYGITVASTTSSQVDQPFVQNAIRDNGIRYHQLSTNAGTGGKIPYDKNKKINSKFDLIRSPCLSQEGIEERLFQEAKKPSWAAKYGALNVGGPDEANMFSGWDGCFCENCRKALVEYLKTEYPSLAALNKAWETSFDSWDKVVARTASEVREDGCKSFASWLDHRTFNDISRANCLGAIQRGIHAQDPELGYSLSGTSETNPWNAWDWYLIMDELYAFSSYIGEQTIQQLSFTKRPIKNMPWSGYDKAQDSEDYSMLNNLMFGASGMSIYGCTFYHNPDWTMPETGIGLKNIIRKYTNGPAELIMASTFTFDLIAFHYSPASIKVNQMTGLELSRKGAVTGFKGLFQDAGLNYSYVAYRQLENKPLDDYKIIVLPTSESLSDKEIKGLASFVRNGGILIADVVPGIYDQHGTPRASADLLAIFGLKKQGAVVKENVVLKGIAGDLKGMEKEIDIYESGIELASAVPHASINGKPAVLVNAYGKGKAVYLACNIIGKCGELGAMRKNPKNSHIMNPINAFFGKFIQEQKVAPQASVDLASTKVVTRQLGSAKIIGIIRDISQTKDFDVSPHDAVVQCREKAHIYDLLERKYIGYTDAFTYHFTATTQSAFLLLPYKPDRIEARREVDSIKVSLAVPQGSKTINHIFRATFTAPDGQVSPAYSGLVFADGAEAVIPFIPPLNQPETGWTVQISDVATNLSTILKF
jgi:hypothetical protein